VAPALNAANVKGYDTATTTVTVTAVSSTIAAAAAAATVGTVLLYNAETWTTTRALERRIDGIYTRLLRNALDVS